jgi:inner membrane protein
MEPVTHILTGAVLARTGFNQRAAYATLAMAIAAELPDIDTLWSLGGPVTGFEHHRGITHTFVAVPVEAALVTAACYVIFCLRKRPATKAPPAWAMLFAGTLLALLSHLLLDWTNNYGVRPFFPFNAHWYAGSFVFIFEPVLFLILLAALLLPGLFSLINSEVGAGRKSFPSPGWAWLALVLIAALYVYRFDEHARALQLAAQSAPPDATRFFVSPHPTNPWLWSAVAESPGLYQLATIHTNSGTVDPPRPSDTLYKPPTTLALLAAKRSFLGRVYLDWSMFPVLVQTPDTSDPNHPLTRVTFSDARFRYNTSLMQGRDHPPLSGWLLLDMNAPEGDRVLETVFDGRPQRVAGD